MAYECRIERDSTSPRGDRLTTFVITFPRIVLAETVTHRMVDDTWGVEFAERSTTDDVSKNSASSRAIPLARMVQKVFDDPYVPERFSANGKGMQGHGWLEGKDHKLAVHQWLAARRDAAFRALMLTSIPDRIPIIEGLRGEAKQRLGWCSHEKGPSVSVHKQDVNRLLEPWLWVTQVVTSSRWDNFFALRCHEAAHPALRHIARLMFLARRKSRPEELEHGQWHLPFVPHSQQKTFEWSPPAFSILESADDLPDLIKHSTARCAWISYEDHDRDGSPEAMLRTFARLFRDVPKHASPCEHQATPRPPGLNTHASNLVGWIQARKLIPLEAITDYDPTPEEIASWGLSL